MKFLQKTLGLTDATVKVSDDGNELVCCFGQCPSSWLFVKKTSKKAHNAVSKGTRGGTNLSYLPLKTETDPVSETLCVFFSSK
jgi:hypothetical protein